VDEITVVKELYLTLVSAEEDEREQIKTEIMEGIDNKLIGEKLQWLFNAAEMKKRE